VTGSYGDILFIRPCLGDELRVHGLDGLRVIDASMMPAVTSTNTEGITVTVYSSLWPRDHAKSGPSLAFLVNPQLLSNDIDHVLCSFARRDATPAVSVPGDESPEHLIEKSRRQKAVIVAVAVRQLA